MDDEGEVVATVREWLARATMALQISGIDTARRDAQAILGNATGYRSVDLIVHMEEPISPAARALADEMLDRRATGMPLAYAVEQQDFYQISLAVTPDVLIPRPDTETLVDAALAKLDDGDFKVLDIGTGSGAIAIAMGFEHPEWSIQATDISERAIEVAQLNAEEYGVDIDFHLTDIWPRNNDRFDLIVSNPPYIGDDEEVGEGVREFEPHVALFSGPTGLEFYERIVPEARSRLTDGGWLMFEVGHTQADAVARLMEEHGYREIAKIKDLSGIERVVIGRYAGAVGSG